MNVLKLIEIVIIMCGVVMIFDARPITKKVFGFGDQNEATKGLKITGFLLTVIGGLMIMLV